MIPSSPVGEGRFEITPSSLVGEGRVRGPDMALTRCLFLAAALLSTLSGCGVDETYTGMGVSALPGQPLNPIEEDVSCNCPDPVLCPEADAVGDAPKDAGPWPEDLTGVAWRFDSLVLTAPLSGTLGEGLNDYFAKEISEGRLHILLAVEKDDRDAGTLSASVGAGKLVEEVYSFDGEPSDLLCLLTGTSFETESPAFLAFPNAQVDPPELPIEALELSGTVSLDGKTVTGGKLVGALPVEDAQEMKILGQSFFDLLAALGVTPDVSLDGEGAPDAFRFEGDWTAASVTMAGGGGS